MTPLASAIAVLAITGGLSVPEAQAGARPFSSEWFNSARPNAGQRASAPAPGTPPPLAQQQRSREHLQRSIHNLGRTAAAVAAQKAAQDAARQAAREMASNIPNGLTEGGLKVDVNPDTAGWINAEDPTQTVEGDHTTVSIKQNADKAILNWETFNVGRDTTVDFDQQANWAALNRVNDPNARPSQIQGQIQGDGTVMIVNRNGVVFSGTSQVNVRNLVAAAADIGDEPFRDQGLYGADNTVPTFTDAAGEVAVEAGARITTHKPESVTQGGGYVLLVGREVSNSGGITTPRGQTALAAGDEFIIRRGVGTDANTHSTTRGNEIAPVFATDSSAGRVANDGLITAREGDITLTGRDVRQQGALLSTTSVDTRGTVHLSTKVSDQAGRVTFGEESVTAIVPEESRETALDSQREALIEASAELDELRLQAHLTPGAFDNLSWKSDRRDLSRVEVVSGGAVDFRGGSLTLATGGQVSVISGDGSSGSNPGGRVWVADRARVDVSGAVGVAVSMASNNIAVNIQGNEQRDAPVNRDSGELNNDEVWVDRRELLFVPAGTQGYDEDRWYTAGGLLEVGGYLGDTERGVGEWLAQGGTVTLAGDEVVTQQSSQVNVSGGTLNVQGGYLYQSWLKGDDGHLYEVSRAPGNQLYQGVYRGFEERHERWGEETTRYHNNPLIGPQRRYESGYTVGLDAGALRIEAPRAVLEGEVVAKAYQGPRQVQGRPTGPLPEGVLLPQNVVPQRGRLGVRAGVLEPYLPSDREIPRPEPIEILFGNSADGHPSAIMIDAKWLNAQSLGGMTVETTGAVRVEQDLRFAAGGEVKVVSPMIDVGADIVAHGGRLTLTNTGASGGVANIWTEDGDAAIWLRDGAALDVSGQWVNQGLVDNGAADSLAWLDGGRVTLDTSGSIVLEQGSLIDVSSGAAMLSDASLKGGRGGDLTLIAGNHSHLAGIQPGELVLDGEIRAVGVNGGGTLTIQSPGILSVAGQPLLPDGALPAGAPAPVDLILVEDLVIPAGTVLPSALQYTVDRLAPGETLTQPVEPVVPFNTHADWVVPDGMRVYGPGYAYYPEGEVVPAGTEIIQVENALPAGYQIPADVFPEGIPMPEQSVALDAGAVTTTDIRLPAGDRIAAGVAFPVAASVQQPVHLHESLFQTGFSHYDIASDIGIAVNEGARLAVTMPVYRPREGAQRIASGADLEQALETWLPPLYREDFATNGLTQRGGASLKLTSERNNRGGSLYVGRDAVIEVDSGQSIGLQSRGQITVEGTLRAPSGDVEVELAPPGTSMDSDSWSNVLGYAPETQSIWIGDNAVLDVAARARVATNALGEPYGVVPGGGDIYLGGNRESAWGADGFVVVREGAVLDASGTQAEVAVPGGTGERGARRVASAGGSITLASFNGIYLDGEARAAAGGAGVTGGRLSLRMDTRSYLGVPPGAHGDMSPSEVAEVAESIMAPREITLVERVGGPTLSEDAAPGSAATSLEYGHARFGVDRIDAGGFDSLDLAAGLIRFDGDLTLETSRRIGLSAVAVMPTNMDDHITVRAPHVALAGYSPIGETSDSSGGDHLRPGLAWGGATETGSARLDIEADLIDVEGNVRFGGQAGNWLLYDRRTTPVWHVERPGFDQVALRSSGDLRFLGTPTGLGGDLEYFRRNPEGQTSLYTSGDLLLSARRIYPGSHVGVSVAAGAIAATNGNNLEFDPERTLRIERAGPAGAPLPPPSVFGELRLGAARVEQGGVVQAPLGMIQLGHRPGNVNVPGSTGVTLLPNSITSVSAKGLVLPYGGTSDGVNYLYNGEAARFDLWGSDSRGIVLAGRSIDVREGAMLDLSGGGELRGAGFISGRGGSVDVRLHPLMQHSGEGLAFPDPADNPVYALIPDWGSDYAPVAPESGAGDPAVGRRITVPAGVPGLPAGAYTLLPSSYALMPGAFRVELHQGEIGAGQPLAMRNGSWTVSVHGGVANTGLGDALPTRATLTPADTVRRYSQYNETGYAEFARAEAARQGGTAPPLPADARQLALYYPALPQLEAPALRFAGATDFTPAEGGRAGQAVINTTQYGAIEIVAGDESTPGFTGPYDFPSTALNADAVNAIGAPRLVIGGRLLEGKEADTNNHDPLPELDPTDPVRDGQLYFLSQTGVVAVRDGVTLSAPEIFLASGGRSDPGKIVIEPGARIDTLSAEAPRGTGSDHIYVPRVAVVGISNDSLYFLPPDSGGGQDTTSGQIDIGICDAPPCTPTELYSQGAIAMATTGEVRLGNEVRYGTRNLDLAVAALNVGTESALARVEADGTLAPGLVMTQGGFSRLLDGDPEAGAPALERLTLTAGDSVNFYGDVDLNTYDPLTGEAKLSELVLNTPAIYGAGAAGERAIISTGTLYWNGVIEASADIPSGNNGNETRPVSASRGEVIAGGAGTGQGVLDLRVDELVLGYAPGQRVASLTSLDRMALGFDTVNVNAAERITSTHKGSLAVYHTQQEQPDGGYQYQGGDLNLVAPLLTGASGSMSDITAGGALTVTAPRGADVAPAHDALKTLGATLSLSGETVTVSAPIVLPSGKLTVWAEQDLLLEEGTNLDLSGRAVDFFDVTRYGFGGDVVLESRSGDIHQAAGSTIDLSARNNHAGTLKATALGEAGGRIDLAGTILGAASGEYDAGGTVVPFEAGGVELRAQSLGDFAALNQRLNDGEVFGARHFQIKQGDLVVGDEVRARDIALSLDGGSLTVNGTLDASGVQVGTIRLAARDDLTLNGTLDAHGTGLRVDNRGQLIEAPNRAVVELTTTAGRLTLAEGARIDLRAGTEQGGAPALGTLDLNVPRVGTDDAALEVGGTPAVEGARRIAVNAFRRYEPAEGLIDQSLLNAIHQDSVAFINAAWNNSDLQARLAGLRGYGDAFHLRPGVELASETDLTVPGDLDFSGYRYGPEADPARRGSGEPGVMVVRAGGDLTINGSITDGFGLPAATPDDDGWILTGLLGDDTVAEFGGVLTGSLSGTSATELRGGEDSTAILAFDAPLRAGAALHRGMEIPFGFVSNSALHVPSWASAEGGWLATADIHDASGTLLYSAGDRVNETLPGGTRFVAGTVLPSTRQDEVLGNLRVGEVTAPAGTPMNVFDDYYRIFLREDVTLAPGTVLPEGMTVAGNVPVGREPDEQGRQGRLWAVAPMLPEGSDSWSLRLAAGADLDAADHRRLRTRQSLSGAGDLTLKDPHVIGSGAQQAPSVIRTGTGDLELLAGGDFNLESLYGIYTAGSPSAAPGGDGAPWDLPRGMDTSTYTENDSILGPGYEDYEALVDAQSDYQAWYPTGGGDLRLHAQGNLLGESPTVKIAESSGEGLVGSWLWRQGSGDEANVATAWWVNFGTYTMGSASYNGIGMPRMEAFTGIGTLGGGNVTVDADGDAGLARPLNLAVGGTGRMDAEGNLTQTGGGDLSLDVGQQLNPTGWWWYGTNTSSSRRDYDAPDGTITNVRGHIDVQAGAVGGLEVLYGSSEKNSVDARVGTPSDIVGAAEDGRGGPALILGDTRVNVATRGDLVLGQVLDAGRVKQSNTTPFTDTATGETYQGGGRGWFTLWTPESGIDLFSAGGNMTPLGQFNRWNSDVDNTYPPSLNAVAASGSLFYQPTGPEAVVLAPSPRGELNLLAAESIHGEGLVVTQSGAAWGDLPTPEQPAFFGRYRDPTWIDGTPYTTNLSPNAVTDLTVQGDSFQLYGYHLYVLAVDTPNGDSLRHDNAAPARLYAVNGDLIDVHAGMITDLAADYVPGVTPLRRYGAARPVWMRAGRDIVGSGTPVGGPLGSSRSGLYTTNVFMHHGPNDVSVVQAGRDIIQSSFRVAGPGTLEVTAGRNLYQADRGEIVSLGPVPGVRYPGEATGADIAVLAGVGANGPDYAALAERYLDPARVADPDLPLADQPGLVVETYGDEATLGTWLRERYPQEYDGTQAPREFFAALPAEQQRIYLRDVYYAELKAGGREFNDAEGPRYGSYLRGREAIATLFPDTDTQGDALDYAGDVTLFSTEVYDSGGNPAGTRDAGIRTLGGGDIQMLVPGGRVVVGVEGITPGGNSGLLTQGEGNIQLYSRDSLLLGLSRIMTTFGGDIQAWSAQGDINAGRGAKTTLVYTPPLRVYDDVGNVTLSPNVPSGGAGIATLAPIPEVPPGDVDLIAPLGTIDAGEAGIRVSGDVNVAALQVVNAENIDVQGDSTGLPAVATVNVGALTSASNAASSAVQAAEQVGRSSRRQPSIIDVEIIGYGEERLEMGGGNGAQSSRLDGGVEGGRYRPDGMVKVVDEAELSDRERRQFGL